MAEAVAKALATGGNVAVAAGTGTGKSLAYLVPAVASPKRVVVATATKALAGPARQQGPPPRRPRPRPPGAAGRC